MKGEMFVIHPGGLVERTKRTKQPSLEELQKAVRGYLEHVPNWDRFGKLGPCVAFCNEEGLREQLPVNIHATIGWREDLDRQREESGVGYDPAMAVLVGPVVVLVGDSEFLTL